MRLSVRPVAASIATAVAAWLLVAMLFSGAQAYQAETVKDSGTIAGTVKYAGTPPPRQPIEVSKDRGVCGTEPHYDQSLVVGEDGGIANAVVTITDIRHGVPLIPLKDVKFDQKSCEYVPHVLAMPVGSTVDIVNSDGILHSVRAESKVNPPLDMAQPPFKHVIVTPPLNKPEIIEVSCDTHNWMQGWWYVADNPYYAVADNDGKFVIRDVPAGTYTLQVWQEVLGTKTRKVTVEPGKTITVDFTMGPKKK
jgi:carboxypeptidase family protein